MRKQILHNTHTQLSKMRILRKTHTLYYFKSFLKKQKKKTILKKEQEKPYYYQYYDYYYDYYENMLKKSWSNCVLGAANLKKKVMNSNSNQPTNLSINQNQNQPIEPINQIKTLHQIYKTAEQQCMIDKRSTNKSK